MTLAAPSAPETAHADAVIDEIRIRMNRERVEAEINQFIDIISSDGFLDYVNGIAELPTFSERRRHTVGTANLDTLKEMGVPTPAGLRLTTREFEFPEDGVSAGTPLVQVRPGTDPRMGFCVSLGYFLCVSFGG